MGFGKRGLSKVNIILIVSVIVILLGVGVFIYEISDFGQVNTDGETQEPQSVAQQCAFACETNQKSGFCDIQRTLPDETSSTCENLASQNELEVQACPAINCDEVADTSCEGLSGEWTSPESDGSCPVQEDMFVRERTPSDSPPVEGQICCYYYE